MAELTITLDGARVTVQIEKYTGELFRDRPEIIANPSLDVMATVSTLSPS